MATDAHVRETGLNSEGTGSFADSLHHLLAELERIDLLIQVAVRNARATHAADAEFLGLCITEKELDALLSKPCGLPRWAAGSSQSPTGTPNVPRQDKDIKDDLSRRKSASLGQGTRLRLAELAQTFALDELALDIVLVCLAPEMDLRYEKIYAYLQDDVTKKRPSVDLILNLLCPTFAAKTEARARFARGSPLIDHELIQLFIDPSQPEPPLLRKYCRLDERITHFLLGRDEIDDRIVSATHVLAAGSTLDAMLLPEALKERLTLACDGIGPEAGPPTVFYFQGPMGCGKESTAAALCRRLGMPLLVVDVARLAEESVPGLQAGIRLALREAALQQAAPFWRGLDGLIRDGKTQDLQWVLSRAHRRPLSFLSGELPWQPDLGQSAPMAFYSVPFPALGHRERRTLWERFLAQAQRADAVDLDAVSNQFRLHAGGIAAAAASAVHQARWRDPGDGRPTMDELYAACRLQSNRKLAALARKIEPKYTLDDIVLPDDPLAQLKEIVDQARNRGIVLETWGFGRKLSLGKGLNALFSGPPGTGKTMAAEVIAHSLRLDLYKIDLSQIVSKYIGETEKNLDQIFREAQGSNAILFFDEADALFGKRSEVKDAHDRYANIEVGYLLQKMEEYEGIAILATNLRQNMDEAFLRRLHSVVEFPFPDEDYRNRIWQVAFPREAPVGKDVNLGALAHDIRLAGGNIKNIALAAAFFAASDGKVVRMSHLVRAAYREHQKLGRTWPEAGGILEIPTRLS